MSGRRDETSGSPSNEPSPENAPVKTIDETSGHINEDAVEIWDNEGGHDRTATAERPKGGALP